MKFSIISVGVALFFLANADADARNINARKLNDKNPGSSKVLVPNLPNFKEPIVKVIPDAGSQRDSSPCTANPTAEDKKRYDQCVQDARSNLKQTSDQLNAAFQSLKNAHIALTACLKAVRRFTSLAQYNPIDWINGDSTVYNIYDSAGELVCALQQKFLRDAQDEVNTLTAQYSKLSLELQVKSDQCKASLNLCPSVSFPDMDLNENLNQYRSNK